jgi:RNA polymerase sigma-70 factor (ECF subfamily)
MELARIYLERLGRPPEEVGADLAQELHKLWERARAAWPGVHVSAEAYVDHLADVLARAEDPGLGLPDLQTDDLYLALACACGDDQAIAAFEQAFGDSIHRSLARQGVDPATMDDLKQWLREWLFVATEERPPQVLTYSGRGKLGGWLRVIIVRKALKSFRGKHRLRTLDEEELGQLEPDVLGGDPEHMLAKLFFRSEFKEAFREAVEGMPDDDRHLLARNLLEGASIDALGEELGIHRSTAARRLEKARRSLFLAIRRNIMQRHKLDRQGYDSVLGMVQSQLDLSVRLLLEGDE